MDRVSFLKKLEEETGPALRAAGFTGSGSGGSGSGYEYRFDEPMSGHTTFRVGGPADLWIRPRGEGFPVLAGLVLRLAREAGIPLFILGGGANLVVSDRGIRGIVLDTGGWTGLLEGGDSSSLWIRAGTPADQAVELAAGRSLSGLEFLAGMPGSIGGAVWMNARCYERSVSDVLGETEFLVLPDLNRAREAEAGWGEIRRAPAGGAEFGYKKSPFQAMDALILAARFTLSPGSPERIRLEAEALRRDREERGQYRFPSAGSAFKNDRALGAPTGKILDRMGLRGFAIGGARVAPWHGNFVINQGNASAGDIRALVEELGRRIRAEQGFAPEPEILFVGEW